MITLTAYETLDNISKIENYEERKHALRNLCYTNNAYAIIVQRCYHPQYKFDLPDGDIPESIATKTNHESPGPFFMSLKHWFGMTDKSEYKTHIKEKIFLDLYTSVSSGDADLLVGIKDKKLPWSNLSGEFVYDSLPELFEGYSKKDFSKSETREEIKEVKETKPRFHGKNNPEKSRREIAREIFKEFYGQEKRIQIMYRFEDLGLSPSTSKNYYQHFKQEMETDASL